MAGIPGLFYSGGMSMDQRETLQFQHSNDTTISKAASREIIALVKRSGLNPAFIRWLMGNRYKVHDTNDLSEAQARSFLEHLKGYGG
jgi:beta-galactosidase/beta-glucuronidase